MQPGNKHIINVNFVWENKKAKEPNIEIIKIVIVISYYSNNNDTLYMYNHK